MSGDLPAPLVELQAVTKTYQMGEVAVQALRGIDLRIAAGEFVAIMGASGSGKSTLMNIIGCLDRPTTGSYLLGGQDVAVLSRNDLADLRCRTLGFVFQQFNLLPRTTAQENVELPLVYASVAARDRHARARRALEEVGLGDRRLHDPTQLSGGQQQRVAIARAIVNRPRLILADEPTGALDTRTSVEVMALLQALGRSGITVVLVTHEPDIAAFAARVLTMRDGQVQSDRPQVARSADQAGPARMASA